MEEYRDKWRQCLDMIRERVQNERLYNTWFNDVVFESYDEAASTLLLRLPSHYVYEYLEERCVAFLRQVTTEVFGTAIVLNYRIQKEPSFADVAKYLEQHGYDSRKDPCHIAIPNARKRMEDGLHYFLHGSERWLPGYDKVVDWLTDNKGRGLLVVGTPGLGKSLICRQILPVILGNGGRKIPSVVATDLRSRFDEVKNERIVIIDDLGKEPRLHFGDRDSSFFELCNNAERNGNLLIITTNLSTTPVSDPRYPDSIENRYGPEVLDRLKAVTSLAIIRGGSLRA